MIALSVNKVQICRATDQDLRAIAELAREIWREHYPGIISGEQIEYMLDWMFDLEEMRRQRSDGTAYELLNADGALVGFASYGPSSVGGESKLDKLYIHETFRGQGLGKRLLSHVIECVREGGADSLVLAVNKKNIDAISMYERNGFHIREAVISDIGSGFVMDDYVMARSLR